MGRNKETDDLINNWLGGDFDDGKLSIHKKDEKKETGRIKFLSSPINNICVLIYLIILLYLFSIILLLLNKNIIILKDIYNGK